MIGQTTAAIKTHNNAWNRLSILNALGLHLPLPQQGQLRSDECGVGSGFLLQFPYIRLRIEKRVLSTPQAPPGPAMTSSTFQFSEISLTRHMYGLRYAFIGHNEYNARSATDNLHPVRTALDSRTTLPPPPSVVGKRNTARSS